MDHKEAARRLIRCRLQNTACQAMLEAGADDRIWTPLLSISSGIVADATRDWWEASKGLTPEEIRNTVLLALTEAPKDYAAPYAEVLDSEMRNRVVEEFLKSFDPDEMQRGQS